jgi:MFS family permease
VIDARAPDAGPDAPAVRGRIAVAVTFLALGIGLGSWATRIPAVQHRLGLGPAELGVALFGIGLGSLASMPLTGLWIARRGSRPVVRVTALAFAASLALVPLAWNLVTLWIALTLFGAAQGALDVAMNAHGVAVEHRYRRPILSSLHAAYSAGALIGAGLGAAAAGLGIDVRAHLGATAVAVALAGLAAGRLLLPADEDRGAEGQHLLLRPPRRLLALGAIAFLCLFAEGAASDWSAVYLHGSLGASSLVAAIAFGAFAGAMMLGRLAGDRVATAIGEVALVRGGAVLGAAGLAVGLLAGNPVVAILAFTCLGAGVAGIVPAVFRAAGTQPGIPSGVGLAAVTTAGYTGFLVGPPVIGTIASVTGLPRALGLVVVSLTTLAVLAGHAHITRRSTAPTG